jgi:hypothetical protein
MPAQDVVGWRVQSLFLGNGAMDKRGWGGVTGQDERIFCFSTKPGCSCTLYGPNIRCVTAFQIFMNDYEFLWSKNFTQSSINFYEWKYQTSSSSSFSFALTQRFLTFASCVLSAMFFKCSPAVVKTELLFFPEVYFYNYMHFNTILIFNGNSYELKNNFERNTSLY